MSNLSTDNLRTFLAIVPTPTIQNTIIQAHQKLQQHLSNVPIKWHPASKLHITVRFCGKLPRESLPSLQSQLTNALSSIPQFQISLCQASLFPNTQKAIAMVHEVRPIPALLNLARIAEEIFTAINLMPERCSYRPHLTIAKIRHVALHQLPHVITGPIPKFWVTQLVLFDSTPKNGEINYTPLYSIPLKPR